MNRFVFSTFIGSQIKLYKNRNSTDRTNIFLRSQQHKYHMINMLPIRYCSHNWMSKNDLF